jgi:hypothetical protein
VNNYTLFYEIVALLEEINYLRSRYGYFYLERNDLTGWLIQSIRWYPSKDLDSAPSVNPGSLEYASVEVCVLSSPITCFRKVDYTPGRPPDCVSFQKGLLQEIVVACEHSEWKWVCMPCYSRDEKVRRERDTAERFRKLGEAANRLDHLAIVALANIADTIFNAKETRVMDLVSPLIPSPRFIVTGIA